MNNRITSFKNWWKINKGRYAGLNPKYSKSDEGVKLWENIVNEWYLDYSRIHSNVRYEDILNTEKRQMENHAFRNWPKKDEEIKNEEVTTRTLARWIDKYIVDNQLEEKGFNVEIPTADDILKANDRDSEEFRKIKKGELYNKLVQKINNKPLFNKNKKITIKFKDYDNKEHKLSFFLNGPSKISDYWRNEEDKRLLPIKKFTGKLETIAHEILERDDVFVVNVTCNVEVNSNNNNFYKSWERVVEIGYIISEFYNKMDFWCYDAIFAVEVHRGENNQYIKSLFKEGINEVEVDENDKRLGNFGRPHLQICLLVGPEKGNELKISKIRTHFQNNLYFEDVKVSKVEPPRGSKRKYLIASDIYNNSFGYAFKEWCALDIGSAIEFFVKEGLNQYSYRWKAAQFFIMHNNYFNKLYTFFVDFRRLEDDHKKGLSKPKILKLDIHGFEIKKNKDNSKSDEDDNKFVICNVSFTKERENRYDILFFTRTINYTFLIKNKLFGYSNTEKINKNDFEFLELFQVYSLNYFFNKDYVLSKIGTVHKLRKNKRYTYERKGIDLKDFIFNKSEELCINNSINPALLIRLLDEKTELNKKGLLNKLLSGLLLKWGRNIDEEVSNYIEFKDYVKNLNLNKLEEAFNYDDLLKEEVKWSDFFIVNLYAEDIIYKTSSGLLKDQKFITFTSVDEEYESYMKRIEDSSTIKQVLKDNLINIEKFMYAYGSLIVNKDKLKKTWRAPYIWGRSRTGKSTIVTRLLEEFLTESNVGLLAGHDVGGERFKLEGILDKKVIVLDEFNPEEWVKRDYISILNGLFGRENMSVKRKYQDPVYYHFTNPSVVVSNYSPFRNYWVEDKEGYRAFLNRIFPFVFFKSSEGKEDPEFEGKVLEEMPWFIVKSVEMYNNNVNEKEDFLMSRQGGTLWKDYKEEDRPKKDEARVMFRFQEVKYNRTDQKGKWEKTISKLWDETFKQEMDKAVWIYRDENGKVLENKTVEVERVTHINMWNLFLGNDIYIKEIRIVWSKRDKAARRFWSNVDEIIIDASKTSDIELLNKWLNKRNIKNIFNFDNDALKRILRDKCNVSFKDDDEED